MDILILVIAFLVILLGAELFTNGIEWFGHRLNLAEGAVGSVLAAVATAMPETLIPVIAILGPVLSGADPEASHAIGVGAILGAPFMLSTLAMFVTGVAVILLAFPRPPDVFQLRLEPADVFVQFADRRMLGFRAPAAIRRAVTDEVMDAIVSMSGQEYVDRYHPLPGREAA